MFAAIIRIDNDRYYVYIDNKNKYISIVLENDLGIKNLSELEIQDLFNNIFSNKLSYIESNNGYEIYKDEVGNRRYFKEGVEDFKQFFLNNGISAVMCKEKYEDYLLQNSPVVEDTYYESKLFKFKIKTKTAGFIISGMLLFNTISDITSIVTSDYQVLDNTISQKELNLEEVQDFIYSSEGNITKEQKEYLINNDFIRDVLEISGNREYELKLKLENIEVEYGGKGFDDESEISGYYSPINPNVLHIRDENQKDQKHILAHEFVHLMQDNNKYYYLREASAEVMISEYYGETAWAYSRQRDSLYRLLETIGPEPIMELNFKGDTDAFEEEIYKYLIDKDADRLLELFSIHPREDSSGEISAEVNELISKMYFNKYKEEEKYDNISSFAFLSNPENRVYFNQSNPAFYKSHDDFEISENKSLQELIDNDLVEKYTYETDERISAEEYHKNDDKPNYYSKYTVSDDFEGDIYPADDMNFWVFDKMYTLEELIQQKVIKTEFYKQEVKTTNNFEELKKSDNPFIRVYLKDGNVGEFVYNSEYMDNDIKHSNIEVRVRRKIRIPSVAEKFPDQVKNKHKEIKQMLMDDSNDDTNMIRKL